MGTLHDSIYFITLKSKITLTTCLSHQKLQSLKTRKTAKHRLKSESSLLTAFTFQPMLMHVTCCSLSTFAVVCFDDSVYFCYSIKSKTYSLIFQRDAYPLLPFLFLLFMFLSFILVLRVLPVVLLSDTVVRSDILRNPVNFSPFYWSSPLSPAAVARRYKFYNPSSRFHD